jgi:hypothetical protein
VAGPRGGVWGGGGGGGGAGGAAPPPQQNALKSKWAFRSKQSAFPQIEDELYSSVMDLRKSGYAVSTQMLQLEASKIS